MPLSKYWSEGMSGQRLAALLKAARVRRNLTQKEAARAAELGQSYISRIETGKLSPSFLDVLKLAGAYNLYNLGSLYRWTREQSLLDRLVKRNFERWWSPRREKVAVRTRRHGTILKKG